ncbi:alkaline phosphatase family protein, partial [Candidatus Woesearchaeota archaeon]|nr:alkaline phosphatase family protein [Candidatus Woesearchaeota archaeon]
MIPNYSKDNLVNLMSSILLGFGSKSKYNDLSELTAEIKAAKNVVLLLIDGMGTDNLPKLKKANKNSFIAEYYHQNLTSVFPATTTAAITTLQTGQAPQEHGLIAWYMYLDEFKEVVSILPFINREKQELDRKIKFSYPKTIYDNLKAETHVIFKKSFLKSPYNEYLSGRSKQWGINNFRGLLRKIKLAIES